MTLYHSGFVTSTYIGKAQLELSSILPFGEEKELSLMDESSNKEIGKIFVIGILT